MFWKSFSICFLFIISYSLQSQGTAGAKASYESRYIIDMPTAGVIEKGDFVIYSSAFEKGGILLEINAAPFSDFNMGISFSGSNIVGSGEVNWQNIPGVHLKYRAIDESKSFPALTLGINTQGRGDFNKHEERFATLSPGLFISLSKNYRWVLGTVAFHAGVNYSFEPLPPKRSPNVYIGLEHSIGNNISMNFEYNATFDDGNQVFMKNKGLLNAALRWSLADGITLELQARDLLENINKNPGFNRSICLEYINDF